MTPTLSRRNVLSTAAAGAAAGLIPVRAQAEVPLQGAGLPLFQRFQLGGFEITTLLAGSRPLEKPHDTFGTNASPEAFAAAAGAAFVPTDLSRNFFTPVLVNTGSELVLFDTGLDPEGIVTALGAAGIAPEQIDIVVLTHMHGDHIGGLSGAAGLTFRKARYVTGEIEFNHWASAENEGFNAKVKPLEPQMVKLADGAEVVPGITALLAPGHTPGHMVYDINSQGQRLLLTADLTNHFAFSLPHPDWEVRFDMDKPTAAASRHRVLGMIADEQLPFIGYHMPFPALGYVMREGEGFRYVPHSYQLLGG